jgi:hypothetical protein
LRQLSILAASSSICASSCTISSRWLVSFMVHRFEVQPTLGPYRQRRSRPMTSRRAACSCGQLHLSIEGEPSRISMCHSLECQRRTGAVISNQARRKRQRADLSILVRYAAPPCAGRAGFPGYVAVAIGNFADPNFPRRRSGCGRSHAIARYALPASPSFSRPITSKKPRKRPIASCHQPWRDHPG